MSYFCSLSFQKTIPTKLQPALYHCINGAYIYASLYPTNLHECLDSESGQNQGPKNDTAEILAHNMTMLS